MKTMSILVLGTMVVSVAAAQGEGGSGLFDELDVDDSGTVSVSEAEANQQVLERFQLMDANSDGLLSREEFAPYGDQE